MSRHPRGLFVEIFKNFVDSLKPRSIKGNLVGKDYIGNEYYEVPPPSHIKRRPARYYQPPGGESNFDDQEVPPEWMAWLRMRRLEPPTEEEIQKNLDLIKMKRENALKLENKFKKPEIGPTSEVTAGNFPKYEEYELFPGRKPDK